MSSAESSLETPQTTRKSLSRFLLSPDSTGSGSGAMSDFGTPFSPTDDEKREMSRSFDMDEDLSLKDASEKLATLRKKREKEKRERGYADAWLGPCCVAFLDLPNFPA